MTFVATRSGVPANRSGCPKNASATERIDPFRAVAGITDFLVTSPGAEEEKKEVVRLSPGQEEELTKISEKMMKVGFEFTVRLVVKAHDQISSESLMNDVIASFKQFTTAHLNSFIKGENGERNSVDLLNDYKARYLNFICKIF